MAQRLSEQAQEIRNRTVESYYPRNDRDWVFAKVWRRTVGIPKLVTAALLSAAVDLLFSVNLQTLRYDMELRERFVRLCEEAREISNQVHVDQWRWFEVGYERERKRQQR